MNYPQHERWSGDSRNSPIATFLANVFFMICIGIAFFAVAIPCWLICNLICTILRPFGYRPMPWGIWNLVVSLSCGLGLAMITQPPLAALIGIPLSLLVLRLRSQKYIDEEEGDIFFD